MIVNVEIPIYRCHVAFLIETDIEELDDFAKRNAKKLQKDTFDCIKDDIKDYTSTRGATYSEGVDYLVYIRNADDDNTIAHELYHLTNVVLLDRGVEHTRTDEPYAYLNGFLHIEFKKVLKEFKKEKSKKRSDRAKQVSDSDRGTEI